MGEPNTIDIAAILPQDSKTFTFSCAAGKVDVVIRRLKPDAAQDAVFRCTMPDRIRGSRLDPVRWREILADAIESWGFTSEGEAYPCTRENKVALLASMNDFYAFVGARIAADDEFRGEGNGALASSITGSPYTGADEAATSAPAF